MLCSSTQTFAFILQVHNTLEKSLPLLLFSSYCLPCSIAPVGLFLIPITPLHGLWQLWELFSVGCLRQSLHASGAAQLSSRGVGTFYKQCLVLLSSHHTFLWLSMLSCFQHSKQWYWCTPPDAELFKIHIIRDMNSAWGNLIAEACLKDKMSQSCEHRCVKGRQTDRHLVLH